MAVVTEPTKVFDLLVKAQELSDADRHWLGALSNAAEEPLPEHATLDEAIGLYLADACSLGRAAELAGVTRWHLIDRIRN